MKAIYIEAFAGISGNMLLGALIDAGVPFDHLVSEMKKLHLGEYELINERVNKCGIDANYFNVLLPDEHQQVLLRIWTVGIRLICQQEEVEVWAFKLHFS